MNGTCFAAYMSIIGTAPVCTYICTLVHVERKFTRSAAGLSVYDRPPSCSREYARAHTHRRAGADGSLASMSGARADIDTRLRDLFIRVRVFTKEHRGRVLFIPRFRASVCPSEKYICNAAVCIAARRARASPRSRAVWLMDSRGGETRRD